MIHSTLATSSCCHFIPFSADLSSLFLLGSHPDRPGGPPTAHIAPRWLLRLLRLLRLLWLRLLTVHEGGVGGHRGGDGGGDNVMRRRVLRLCRRRLRRFHQRWDEPCFATVRRWLTGQLQKSLFDTPERRRRQRRRRPGRHSAVQTVQGNKLQRNTYFD